MAEQEIVDFPAIVTTRRTVPNQQPTDEPGTKRIALVGEAPGETEENHRVPFVGKSGDLLEGLLRDVGIDRRKCLVGNVCQVRPPGNNINLFKWEGEEIQSGLTQLSQDIRNYNPHITVLLGSTPLRAAHGDKKKITDWRGSLFRSALNSSPVLGRKCISSLHPAFVLREWSGYPLLKFDLTRAADESATPELILPQREILTNLSADQLCYLLDTWPAGLRCSVDIEGGLPIHSVNLKRLKSKGKYASRFGWACVGISGRPTKAFVIVWKRLTDDGHAQVLRSFARLMDRTDVPKVLQNQLYDNFVLGYGYGIPIRNVYEDVMIKGWEIYAELPRGLSTQASIYTRQPHWKDESMYSSDGEGLAQGCGIDAAVTLEICEVQDSLVVGSSREHYRKMLQIQDPFLYMQHRGMKYDQEKVNRQLEEVQTKGWEDGKPHEPMCMVADRLESAAHVSLRGPKGSLVPQRLAKLLYVDGVNGHCYPPQYKKEQGRKTKELTTDAEALLTLKRHRPHDTFLSDLLLHRHLEKLKSTLSITADGDGRVRCGYSLEAETGRVKCYTSPTGSGANMQTIQKLLRPNYVADPGFDFCQCDLEGADGWTVAAHSARLGDTTMWDDYRAGLKPAKIIGLYYWAGPEVGLLDRESLKFAVDEIFPLILKETGSWLYLGCKRVQHGSSYLMGILTMLFNVLKDSYKESGEPVYMEASAARVLQTDCFFQRYRGVQLWHAWAESKLLADGELVSASGHKRVFMGRRFGQGLHDTVKEFLAHEPQNNTTWATNLAALNLWNDPENRKVDGSLIIEPLHQVHDALCVQWPSVLRDWARAKMRTYFNNTLNIAGQDIVIPFEGHWGPAWEQWEGKV